MSSKSSSTPNTPEEKAEAAKFENAAPKNIPRADEGADPAHVAVGGGPSPELEDFEGKYRRKSDGELYALAIVPDDRIGRTHKATNTAHYWEGTEAQFREQFTEENGSPIREAKASVKKAKK